MYWYASTHGVLLDTTGGVVRTTLRIFTVLAIASIGVCGDRCCYLRNMYKRLNDQDVQVTDMTGWLRGPNLARALWQLRRLPGGYFGGFMAFTAILSLVTDFAVSGLVKSIQWPGRCNFTRGLVLPDAEEVANATIASNPDVMGTFVDWAWSSQLTSAQNQGLVGVYKMADNSSDFSAQIDDVIGWWNCSKSGDLVVSEHVTANVNDIGARLQKEGWINSNGTWQACSVSPFPPFADGQLSFISFSTFESGTPGFDSPVGPFDVKFVIDMHDDTAEGKRYLQPFKCACHSVNGTGSPGETILNTIQNRINTSGIALPWSNLLRSKLFDGYNFLHPVTDVNEGLERLLNSMMMIAGANNAITTLSGKTYGCSKSLTLVPIPVLVLLVFTTTTMLLFLIWMLTLEAMASQASKRLDRPRAVAGENATLSSKIIKKRTPNGLVEWMREAGHDVSQLDSYPKTHSLRQWLFKIPADGQSCSIRKSTTSVDSLGHGSRRSLLRPSNVSATHKYSHNFDYADRDREETELPALSESRARLSRPPSLFSRYPSDEYVSVRTSDLL